MKKIHEVAKDVKNKLKSNIQYLLARDARQKLKSFTIWLMVISIIGFAVLSAIVGLVTWIIVTKQWGRDEILPVYGGIMALVIIDLVLLIGWFALMILVIIVSRKAGEPLNGKGINILYLSLLVTFVVIGIVVIVLFFMWTLGYLDNDTQRFPVVISIAVLEGIRAGILLTVFITACRYRYILRKFFKEKK